MINFSEFLTESRSAPLYHGTQWINIEDILIRKQGIKSDTKQALADFKSEISPRYRKQIKFTFGGGLSYVTGVSLTRSKDFAYYYSRDGVVLQINQSKLAQNYKIVPFRFFQKYTKSSGFGNKISNRNELEEFVITDKPIPISYIDKIIINENGINSEENYTILNKITQMYGSSFVVKF